MAATLRVALNPEEPDMLGGEAGLGGAFQPLLNGFTVHPSRFNLDWASAKARY